jgi:hypothetical protein
MTGRDNRPSLARRGLWEKRRTHYLAVLERALMLLRQHESLPASEPAIVRKLRVTAVTACRELDTKGRYQKPLFEMQNLPDPAFEEAQAHDFKIPDIQWLHDDHAAPDDKWRQKAFVIECKRLGAKSGSWDLNENYVTRGVARFRLPGWRYGNHMHEGMMIGFVQDMTLDAILSVVNDHLSAHDIPELRFSGRWAEAAITELDHQFDRPFPKSPFQLFHRWLDIRDIPKVSNLVPPPESSLDALASDS